MENQIDTLIYFIFHLKQDISGILTIQKKEKEKEKT